MLASFPVCDWFDRSFGLMDIVLFQKIDPGLLSAFDSALNGSFGVLCNMLVTTSVRCHPSKRLGKDRLGGMLRMHPNIPAYLRLSRLPSRNRQLLIITIFPRLLAALQTFHELIHHASCRTADDGRLLLSGSSFTCLLLLLGMPEPTWCDQTRMGVVNL